MCTFPHLSAKLNANVNVTVSGGLLVQKLVMDYGKILRYVQPPLPNEVFSQGCPWPGKLQGSK